MHQHARMCITHAWPDEYRYEKRLYHSVGSLFRICDDTLPFVLWTASPAPCTVTDEAVSRIRLFGSKEPSYFGSWPYLARNAKAAPPVQNPDRPAAMCAVRYCPISAGSRRRNQLSDKAQHDTDATTIENNPRMLAQ